MMSFDVERFREILADDKIWDALVEKGRCDDADLDAYEQRFGVVLPEAYRWVRLNYPGLVLRPRGVDRGGDPQAFLQLGQFFGLLLERVTEGLDTAGEGLGPEMLDWMSDLFTHNFCDNGGNQLLAFDYAFDPTNPPIVEFDGENTWRHEADDVRRGRGRVLDTRKLRYVADSFVDLIELPRSEGAGEIGPKQQREEEWVQWRNERLLRFIDE